VTNVRNCSTIIYQSFNNRLTIV